MYNLEQPESAYGFITKFYFNLCDFEHSVVLILVVSLHILNVLILLR